MGRFESTYARLREQLEATGERGVGIDFDDSIADTNTYWAGLVISRYGHPKFRDPVEVIRAYHYVRNVPE